MLIIYFDKSMKCRQVVRPNPQFFGGDYKSLVDAITGSYTEPSGRYIKTYFKYEIF